MTCEEILALIVGTLLLGALLVVACVCCIITFVEDNRRKRTQERLAEKRKNEKIDILNNINYNLYEINKTLNRKDIKNNEKR